MLKTNIKHKYAVVLAEELGKRFGAEFLAVDAGVYIGLVPQKKLAQQSKKQIQDFVSTYEKGVAVVEAELAFK